MPKLLRWCYLLLIAWQAIWLGYLSPPYGPGLGLWGVLVSTPLLLTLKGVWRTDHKGINWASYLLILYFVLGVSEACLFSAAITPVTVDEWLPRTIKLPAWTESGLTGRLNWTFIWLSKAVANWLAVGYVSSTQNAGTCGWLRLSQMPPRPSSFWA